MSQVTAGVTPSGYGDAQCGAGRKLTVDIA